MHVNCAVVTRLSSLQWRHTLSNHRHLHCLLNCWFRRRSKKTSKFHVAGVRGIHQWWVNSPHKRPVTRNMFPFDDVIMSFQQNSGFLCHNTSYGRNPEEPKSPYVRDCVWSTLYTIHAWEGIRYLVWYALNGTFTFLSSLRITIFLSRSESNAKRCHKPRLFV